MRDGRAVRLATVDDAGEVARLLHDFNVEFDTPSPGVATLTTRLCRLLGDATTVVLLAGAPAFGVALVTTRTNVWYDGAVALLDELYVTPDRRSHGTGTALIAELLAWARSNAVDLIEINVDEGDVDAQRFYERNGFISAEPTTNERAFYYFLEL